MPAQEQDLAKEQAKEEALLRIAAIEEAELAMYRTTSVRERHRRQVSKTQEREHDKQIIFTFIAAIVGWVVGGAMFAWFGLSKLFGGFIGSNNLGLRVLDKDVDDNTKIILTADEQIQAVKSRGYIKSSNTLVVKKLNIECQPSRQPVTDVDPKNLSASPTHSQSIYVAKDSSLKI